jgi:hypothetical protein
MKPPVLLCFNIEADKAAGIRLLAMRLGVRLRNVPQGEFGETLAVLCGWEPPTGAPPPAPFTDEMLVLANFSGTQLNQFLSGFQAGRIPPVALKAVLTEANRTWDAAALHRELLEEHRAMAARTASPDAPPTPPVPEGP